MNRNRNLMLSCAIAASSLIGCMQPPAEAEFEDSGPTLDAGPTPDAGDDTTCVLPVEIAGCFDAGDGPTKCCHLEPTSCQVCAWYDAMDAGYGSDCHLPEADSACLDAGGALDTCCQIEPTTCGVCL